MFSFIFKNAVVIDEFAYMLCGLICVMTGSFALKNKKSPIGTFLFWSVLGILFIFGRIFVNGFKYGGTVIGAVLIFLGILTLSKRVQTGELAAPTKEEVNANSKTVGNKVFIPALLIGIIAMFLAQMKSFNIQVGTNDAGKAVIFGFSTAQVVGISSIIAFIAALLIARPKLKETGQDTARMLMQIGSSSLLPQLLGVLGVIFAVAGIGNIIGYFASGIVPAGVPFAGVVAYCAAMMLFTMIMGNAFAAFTVITIGVGIPFVIKQGGNPAVVGSLGMTAGFCGTLLTPMAANFNIVSAAILETKNKYSIIFTQVFMALSLLAVHIILMLIFAF